MASRFSVLILCLLLLTIVLSGNALSELTRVADGPSQSPYDLPLGELSEEEESRDEDGDDFLVLFVTYSGKVFEPLQKLSSELNDTTAILIVVHGSDSPRAPPIVAC